MNRSNRLFSLVVLVIILCLLLPFSLSAQDDDEMAEVELSHPALVEFFRAFEEGDNLDSIEDFVHEDFIWYFNDDEAPQEGFPAVIGTSEFLRAAFPGFHFEVYEEIVGDDVYAVHFALVGTHTGDTPGLPATGNELVLNQVGIYRIEEGKVIEFREFFDNVVWSRALGIPPSTNAERQ